MQDLPLPTPSSHHHILPNTVPSPSPRHLLSVSQMLIHKCRLPGKVINDGSCGPSHSPSLPDLVLPLFFLVARLYHPPKERDKRSRARGRGGTRPYRVAAVGQALCQAFFYLFLFASTYIEKLWGILGCRGIGLCSSHVPIEGSTRLVSCRQTYIWLLYFQCACCQYA